MRSPYSLIIGIVGSAEVWEEGDSKSGGGRPGADVEPFVRIRSVRKEDHGDDREDTIGEGGARSNEYCRNDWQTNIKTPVVAEVVEDAYRHGFLIEVRSVVERVKYPKAIFHAEYLIDGVNAEHASCLISGRAYDGDNAWDKHQMSHVLDTADRIDDSTPGPHNLDLRFTLRT
jgi:hypothetical protein